MTYNDFVKAGLVVTFEQGHKPFVQGPKAQPKRDQLLGDLQYEVMLRVPLVGTTKDIPKGEFKGKADCCDLCGDFIGKGRANSWCILCVLARYKVIKAERLESEKDGKR